jgi:hypothetical protein
VRYGIVLLLAVGCGSDPNGGAASSGGHLPDVDAAQPRPDASSMPDASTSADASTPDAWQMPDAARNDASQPDAFIPPDAFVQPDASTRPACLNGRGWAAFRFHYSPNNGTNAIVDAFGLSDSSNWEATPVYSTSVVDSGNGGGLEIASGNWILIRYSVAGLTQINGARFSMYGRSYDTTTSGSFEAWTPLYGSASSPTNSVSNAWPYAWTTVDFTGFVQVGDDPGLTGIRLYAGPNSNDLAIHTVELCIDGQ